jgi:type I restriction enzyme S subunit
MPPLAEQHRIVAKVDELMALCDGLEAAQAKRESRRDRLVAATLHGLNNGGATAESGAPVSFSETARFYFNHLPRLTTRPEHIHQLRQTILNLAVRGKLVPQVAIEPLPEGIRFHQMPAAEAPFLIPPTWRWTRLGDLGQLCGGGTPSKANDEYWGGDIPWVSPKDMKRPYIDSSLDTITAKALNECAVKLIDEGSILFVVRGMILAHSFPVAIGKVRLTVNQDMKALTLTVSAMGEFTFRSLMGLRNIVLGKVQRSTHGTCRLDSRDYESLLFPVPPLAEQRRIVSKVDELMSLCDELEKQLTSAAAMRLSLLEATLQEALAAIAASSVATSRRKNHLFIQSLM